MLPSRVATVGISLIFSLAHVAHRMSHVRQPHHSSQLVRCLDELAALRGVESIRADHLTGADVRVQVQDEHHESETAR